ncbi:3'-5' exoribonuclease [Yersinia ruckeri]|uniref:3'-5' exonuclease n=1 Tax=Yersinia ruckeri TaxID=29486 RepID=UPI001F3D4558|nr:3'-5' exonuclease [Yersinia ruckeri]UIN08439.1 3'-5' exoribonuclease [Yersinia ruckeri]
MKNLMIDLETMGNKPNAPIVAIGAVFFEPATGEIGAEFYTAVDLESEMSLGAIADASTILWWLTQSSESRSAIAYDPTPIRAALLNLNQFAAEHCHTRYLHVWGNGAAFDNVILRSAYERCQLQPCWSWFNDLDVRTIVKLGRAIGFDPKRDMPFDGERHNALADALHQARYVSAIYQKLIPATSPDSE